jgi:hypothetical protein
MNTEIKAEELDRRCQCARRIGWVTKNLLSRAPPCFGTHSKLLVPAAFVVVSTHQPHWAHVVGYGPFSLCVIHKESQCPSSGGINRLMMMMNFTVNCQLIVCHCRFCLHRGVWVRVVGSVWIVPT